MRPRTRRLLFIGVSVPLIAVAGLLAMTALRDQVVFFYGPSEAREKQVPAGQNIRLGGLVEPGSVSTPATGGIAFRVTDNVVSIPVEYAGAPPDLFREGQGVVAEGAFTSTGGFKASRVLAKHDETYMPPEVAQALKDAGRWQEGGEPSS